MKNMMKVGLSVTYIFYILSVVSCIQHDNTPTSGTKDKIDASLELNEWVNSRLGAVEQRLNWKFHDVNSKITKLNHTLEIAQLEKLFHMVNEELQISQERELNKDNTIKALKGTVSEQNKELHHLKKRIGHLENTLEDLKELIAGNIGGRKQHTTSTAKGGANRPKITTEIPDAKPLFPKDCEEAYINGVVHATGSVKTYAHIKPLENKHKFKVLCKLQRDEGWTVIQNRYDGSVDFFRGWEEYKHGFGNFDGEFWLGLEKIYHITNQADYKLRIEMTSWEGNDYWAEYDHFRVATEDDHYRLHIHGYNGNAGDSFTSRRENHNGQPFSTKDSDNDGRFYDNCASDFNGAWWFTSCFDSHLNGIYYQKGSHNNYFQRNGIQWNTIHPHSSLRAVKMMLLPNDEVVEPAKTKGEDVINDIG